ncbi:MAG: hypothetical protein KAR87_02695 [Candidatus Aenigmarchaeota archaeon]|nr:hypothetical protein [Candidatus Aenigmarchaeota archaeon]
MDEGVKLVVKIMVALIIAFGVIYVFSERILGVNEKILEPTERDSSSAISTSLCKIFHGNKEFPVTGDTSGTCDDGDCGSRIFVSTPTDCINVNGDGATTADKCCCKCE